MRYGMKKSILLIAIACAFIATPVMAADDCAPYYHKTKPNSIGSKLADIFLLPGTLIIGAVGYSANKATPLSTGSDPFCMPKALGKHLIEKPKVTVNFNLK